MSKPKHHIRGSVCATRAAYREGRKAKAVKVYAVHQESRYLLVQGIPGVGATKNLIELFEAQGEIAEHRMLDDYPCEQFTEVCLIKYKKIQSARYAKRHLDDWSFFGGVLHVCYAPEYESVQETREKLQDRRKVVAAKVRQFSIDGTYSRNTEATNDVEKTDMSHATALQMETRNSLNVQEPTTSMQSMSHSTNHFLPLPSSRIETQSVSNSVISTNVNAQKAVTYEFHHSYSDIHRSVDTEVELETRTDESEHLVLPPPPKQRKITHNPNYRQIKPYQWRVPSAQATFPPEFDARTDKPNIEDSGVTLSEYLARKGPNAEESKDENIDDKSKSVQDVIEENLKTSNLVIKKLPQKPTAPKFIPRQAQARFKPKPATGIPSKSSAAATNEPNANKKENDHANNELRKNAFTLGKPQGPKDLEELERERPTLEDVSVLKTVRQIRQKLTEVTQTTGPVQSNTR